MAGNKHIFYGFVPETPEVVVLKLLFTFGSYNSNPSGNLISGFLSASYFHSLKYSL